MNSNAFLCIFGLDPDCFDKVDGPIIDEGTAIYEAWESRRQSRCPKCGCPDAHVHHRYEANIRVRGDAIREEILIAHRIIYRCKGCGKTFSNPIRGVEESHAVSIAEKAEILAELRAGRTFSGVAERHRISVTSAVRVFDQAYPAVGRGRLPKILLIDEFKFKTDAGKYVCHLVDFETSQTVDLVRSRAKAYLDEYFRGIDEKERSGVKYVVTDMYDEYAMAARRWLPNAKVVVDRFHVVKQLTEAVNSIRVASLSLYEKGDAEYAFMKQKWKAFLCRKADIPDRYYSSKKTGESWHYDEMVSRCLDADPNLKEAWNELQDLLWLMKRKDTFLDAVKEIDFLSTKLKNCSHWRLQKVGETFGKWRIEIARGMAKNELGVVLSNGKMEAANDVAQTFIDAAYGYCNFDRFRKRFLLLRREKKRLR